MMKDFRPKLIILAIAAVPAFTGYPLEKFEASVMPGVTVGWLVYFLLTHFTVLWVSGRRLYVNFVAVAALIALPVVLAGGTISYLLLLVGWGDPGGQPAYSAHYLALLITMLTVIPLGIAMVAAVPFQAIERNVFTSQTGFTRPRKYFLMFVRVFIHIAFFVIPNMLEVIREESLFGNHRSKAENQKPDIRPGRRGRLWHLKHRLEMILKVFIQIGVEGICSSIQYVPFWAVEISKLPDKRRRGQSSDEGMG